ncbi:MAG: YbjN domain-containing protein, partial [Propionibacteriaceae bacterium]|nr:YbjN domain-containing protein [Propionibacteriaceae bacterium]
YGHRPFRDSEGDIAIRVGSTVVFIRSTPDAREIVLFSALVHDVAGRSRAAEVLNDLNVESRFGRFALHRDRVFVQMSVPAQPFVPAHLHQGLKTISQIADGIDDELAARLQGRTTFDTAGD